jgi:hypothetical protein
MMNSSPSESLSKAECASFLQHHIRRLSLILQSHAVSQLFDETFPVEYLYLTRDLCGEERWALGAAYKGMLELLPGILEVRSKVGTAPVSEKQRKNIELALSILQHSVWRNAGRSNDTRDSHQETASKE